MKRCIHKIVQCPLQAQWPKFHVNPIYGLRGQPSDWCTLEPHERPWRKRKPHLKSLKSCTCLGLPSWCICWDKSVTLSGKVEKEVVAASVYHPWELRQKRWSQAQRQVVSTQIERQVRRWKKADCFTLLKRNTRLKNVNSETGSEAQVSYLERYSPKGSCHHDESSMSHTLAQNYHCEFCCGMHLTSKNAPIIQLYLTGMGRWKDPREIQEVTIAKANARWKEYEADPSLSTKPNRSHLDRVRRPYRNWNGHWKFKTDVTPVLGVAGCHSEKC